MRGRIVLTLVLFLAGCSRTPPPDVPAPEKAPAAEADPVMHNYARPWKTESQFVVIGVATALAAWALKAGDPALSNGPLQVEAVEHLDSLAEPRYELEIKTGEGFNLKASLPVPRAIWMPETYGELAQNLVATVKAAPAAEAAPMQPEDDFLQALAAADAPQLAALDRALTEELNNHPAGPELHERAALLQAALALADEAGHFSRIHGLLNRMTAHLALADALQPERVSSLRVLAGAALAALAQDSRRARINLEALAADTQSMAAWRQALLLRVTGDYRIPSAVMPDTWVEKRERYRAIVQRVGALRAWSEHLQYSDTLRARPDWMRIVRTEQGRKLGQDIVPKALAAELAEVTAVRAVYFPQATVLPPARLLAALKIDPEAPASENATRALPVIGWALWTDFAQRHLLHALEWDHAYWQELARDEAKAKAYRDEVLPLYRELHLFPFVQRVWPGSPAERAQAQADALARAESVPHLVPTAAWTQLLQPVESRAPVTAAATLLKDWFKLSPLPGSDVDSVTRFQHPSFKTRPDLKNVLGEMLIRSPYDRELASHILAWKFNAAPSRAVVAAYQPILEYDIQAMLAVADSLQAEPNKRLRWWERASERAPEVNYRIAEYWLQAGDKTRAARAYEQAFKLEIDELRVVEQCEWLIAYHELNGDPTRANALAARAARTGTLGGMTIRASLFERRGDHAAAYEAFAQLAERQQKPALLGAYLLRFERTTGDYSRAPELDQLWREYFPNGVQRLEPDTMAVIDEPAPEEGVRWVASAELMATAHLAPSDVIVAARGIRVADSQAFTFLRDLEPTQPMAVAAWRGGKRFVVKVPPSSPLWSARVVEYAAK